MNQDLSPPFVYGWSYQKITRAYKILGKQLQEYEGVRDRIEIPSAMDIDYTDQDNIFIARFWREVHEVNDSLVALDQEIARRNKLVGVM